MVKCATIRSGLDDLLATVPNHERKVMRRLSVFLFLSVAMAMSALPALAQEENPLANAVLFTGTTAWGMVGLAVLLMILFILWARRGPN